VLTSTGSKIAYTITEDAVSTYSTTISGSADDGFTVTNKHLVPQMEVTKTVTSTPADGTAYAVGETITYEITVKNTGNTTITGITVTDDLTGEDFTIDSLAAGATSDTFKVSYTVTDADVLAGSVSNTATAKGTAQDPENPDDPTKTVEVEGTPDTVEVKTVEPCRHDPPVKKNLTGDTPGRRRHVPLRI